MAPSGEVANHMCGKMFGDATTELSKLVQVGSTSGSAGNQADSGGQGNGGRNAGNYNASFAGFTNTNAEKLLGQFLRNKWVYYKRYWLQMKL
jgi:hypothetical protein